MYLYVDTVELKGLAIRRRRRLEVPEDLIRHTRYKRAVHVSVKGGRSCIGHGARDRSGGRPLP